MATAKKTTKKVARKVNKQTVTVDNSMNQLWMGLLIVILVLLGYLWLVKSSRVDQPVEMNEQKIENQSGLDEANKELDEQDTDQIDAGLKDLNLELGY